MPGDCEAAGYYAVCDTNQQAFVVSQRNGIWNKAIHVPGLGSLNVGNSHVGKSESVDSLSCAAPGDCNAGGQYTAKNGKLEAFVVTERNGAGGYCSYGKTGLDSQGFVDPNNGDIALSFVQ